MVLKFSEACFITKLGYFKVGKHFKMWNSLKDQANTRKSLLPPTSRNDTPEDYSDSDFRKTLQPISEFQSSTLPLCCCPVSSRRASGERATGLERNSVPRPKGYCGCAKGLLRLRQRAIAAAPKGYCGRAKGLILTDEKRGE